MKNDKPKTAAGRYAAELESASTAVGCLQTAIELCQIGDIKSAARWAERANEKLQRAAAMPNEQKLSHGHGKQARNENGIIKSHIHVEAQRAVAVGSSAVLGRWLIISGRSSDSEPHRQ